MIANPTICLAMAFGLLSTAAFAQQNTQTMSAEELAKMFGSAAAETTAASPKADTASSPNVAYSANELAAILAPSSQSAASGGPVLRTRGLKPGGAETAQAQQPAPGQAGSGVVPNLQINFEFNSAALTEQARQQLDALGTAMNMEQLSTFRFEIGGHTDAKGSDAYNQQLSQQRAESVANYLSERHQVNPTRVQPVGYGEAELADPADPGNWVNRRVEVRRLGG